MNTSATKALLLQDYLVSGCKDLGEFALSLMRTYDDIAYELAITHARDSKGHMVYGHASAPTRQAIEEIIKINGLKGDFKILEIDCQKKFFLILAEIRDDLKVHKRYTRSKSAARMEG